ncbi:MAG: serine/threonine-protein phosphatase [Candidatus Cloacimonetes bacterium]|nr:serine/threonine-protein phosphatase [Candidatus Cloacimonadota bacterium]
MKSQSLYVYLLTLVFKFFAWIVILLTALAFYYFINSYNRNLGDFYNEVNHVVFEEERKYDQEINKLQKYLMFRLNKLEKSIKKNIKNKWIEKLSDKDYRYKNNKLALRVKRKQVLEQKFLYKFQRLSKDLTKKYNFVDQSNIRVTFHDLALANHMMNFYKAVSADSSNSVIATISNKTTKESVANILPNMFTNLFARRLSYSDKIDFLFSAPSRVLFKIDINPHGTTFQKFKFLNRTFYIFYSGFTAAKGKEQKVFSSENLKHIKSKNRFIGFLSCTIDMQNIYKSFMNKLEGDLWNHTLIDSYNYKTELKAIIDSKQKINILNENTLQIVRKDVEFLPTVIDSFKNRKNLKFSYVNKDGQEIYNALHFDGLLQSFAHLFQIDSNKLSAPIYKNLKSFSVYTLIVFLTLIGLGFLGTFYLTRPISRLRALIDDYKNDFDTKKFTTFNHGSSEVKMLKNSILNQVNSIHRHISIINALHTMHDAIAQKYSKDKFDSLSFDIFERLFDSEPTQDISEVSFTISSDRSKTYFKSCSYLNRAELRPFIEQYHFYYQRDELQNKYMSSIVQKKQFELAEKAQKDLMPKNDISNKHICSFYKAARFLGGDFYDNFAKDLYEYYIIADVSGKGLAASLYGLLVKSYLMALMQNTEDLSTSELLSKLNYYLVKQKKDTYFCTLFLAKLNHDTKVLEYASAGHNNMIVKKTEKIEFLSTKGLPIGMMDMDLYESKTHQIDEGSLLFLYTDGVTEAENSDLDLYGEDKLYDFLETFQYNDPYLLSSRIEQDLNEFCGSADQSDDITFVSIQLDRQV